LNAERAKLKLRRTSSAASAHSEAALFNAALSTGVATRCTLWGGIEIGNEVNVPLDVAELKKITAMIN
jgi:hypothetical protein